MYDLLSVDSKQCSVHDLQSVDSKQGTSFDVSLGGFVKVHCFGCDKNEWTLVAEFVKLSDYSTKD